MAQHCSSVNSSEEYTLENETHVEHCSFQVTVIDFKTRFHMKKPELLGRMTFRASENDGFFTLWCIEINAHPSRTDENIAKFSLTRLYSKKTSTVFARFSSSVRNEETNIDSFFPITIHSNFGVGDTISKEFIKSDGLLEEKWINRYGRVNIVCELTVFEQNVEKYISSEVKKGINSGLLTLSSDMDKLRLSEAYADATLATDCERAPCHKAVLVSRSCVFSTRPNNVINKNILFYVGKQKLGLLGELLKHVYSGINDFYLKHTIPNGLKEMAEELGLLDLQKYIDEITSVDIATLHCMDITWKIYCFPNLLSWNDFRLSWPREKNRTLFNEKWRMHLVMKGSMISIVIYVARKAAETSEYVTSFKVEIITQGVVALRREFNLNFNVQNTMHSMPITTREEIRKYLTGYNLVLNCSLKLHESATNTPRSKNYSTLMSTAIDSFKTQTITNLLNLSKNIKQLFENERLTDAVIETQNRNFRVHSYLLTSRLLDPLSDIEFVLKFFDCRDIESFIYYLYSGKMTLHIHDPNMEFYQSAYDKLSAPQKIVIKKYLELLICISSKGNRYLDPESYRGHSKIRNDPLDHFNSPIYGEIASNVENEVNRISKIFDRSTTFTKDDERKLVTLNPITLNSSYRQEQCRPVFGINTGCPTTKGNYFICSEPKYGEDLATHQDACGDSTVNVANSCNTDFHHPTGEADSEVRNVIDNMLMQHPSLPDTASSSGTSNEYNELPFGMTIKYFSNACYSYTIRKAR